MLYGEIEIRKPLIGQLQEKVIDLGEKEKQKKTIIPTEEEQNVRADVGFELEEVIVKPIPTDYEIPVIYDGETTIIPTEEIQTLATNWKKLLDDVKIEPIPDEYADVSNVDATAEDVLNGKIFVDNEGNEVQGTAELKEDLTTELTAQDEAITSLENAVDSLPDNKTIIWKPHQDWYDIQKVLDESEDIEGYPYKGVALFANARGNNYGFGSHDDLIIKTSDGDTFEVSSTSTYRNVTFTGINDKPCYLNGIEVYRTRYCIVYSKGENWNHILGLYSFGASRTSLLWVVYNKSIMPITTSRGRLTDYVVLEKLPPVLKDLSGTMLSQFNAYSLRAKVSFPENGFYSMTDGFRFLSDETLHIDASGFTTMNNYFRNIYGDSSVKKLVFSNTSHIENFNTCFYYSYGLNAIEGLDLLSATSFTSALSNCYYVAILDIKNIKISIDISNTNSNVDSLINTIKELWDYSGGENTHTLTIGSDKLAKLTNIYVKLINITDEMRAEDEYIDNKKPFVVCKSTDEGAMLITEYATSKNWQLA